MGTQVDMAKKRLFDKDALAVTNIKLYPGTDRDIAPEAFADQLNKSLSQIEAGDYEMANID